MPQQVDISEKAVIYREATAVGRIRLSKETVSRIKKGRLEKGDPVSIAETMSILGTKLTPQIIALCHQLRIEKVKPVIRIGPDWIELSVTVSAHEKTGVEMEALVAVSVGLLNIWDVTKAYEKDEHGQYPTTAIEGIRVTKKIKGNH